MTPSMHSKASQPLQGIHLPPLIGRSASAAYGISLLRSLGAEVGAGLPINDVDAVVDWAESGLMYLCGEGQAPQFGPGAIPSCARGALQALRALAPGLPASLDGAHLLTERAALMGLRAQGQDSPNKSCHLFLLKDGWIALNLARDDDRALLPAWLEWQGALDSREQIALALRQRCLAPLIERGRLLGLPVAPASGCQPALQWCHETCRGKSLGPSSRHRLPLVVDLSSLWAGPLCSHLLQQAGARVIKVESAQRLDGARHGNIDFYHLLNGGKASVVLDLTTDEGRAQLRTLLGRADIVIEGSRPRALRQLGIHAEQMVGQTPDLTWVALSGYGRGEPEANWVAFGDDAAAAAGVCEVAGDPPQFCGDALADPLTGIHAALAAWAYWRAGGGVLLDLSLREVTAYLLSFGSVQVTATLEQRESEYFASVSGHSVKVAVPGGRQPQQAAPAPGEHTAAVLEEFALPC